MGVSGVACWSRFIRVVLKPLSDNSNIWLVLVLMSLVFSHLICGFHGPWYEEWFFLFYLGHFRYYETFLFNRQSPCRGPGSMCTFSLLLGPQTALPQFCSFSQCLLVDGWCGRSAPHLVLLTPSQQKWTNYSNCLLPLLHPADTYPGRGARVLFPG